MHSLDHYFLSKCNHYFDFYRHVFVLPILEFSVNRYNNVLFSLCSIIQYLFILHITTICSFSLLLVLHCINIAQFIYSFYCYRTLLFFIFTMLDNIAMNILAHVIWCLCVCFSVSTEEWNCWVVWSCVTLPNRNPK